MMKFNLLFLLAITLVLSHCTQKNEWDDIGRTPYPYKTLDQATINRFLTEFPIVSPSNGAPVLPANKFGIAPFGVAVHFEGGDSVGLCTATHWRKNKVITNAHCVLRAPFQNYYLVYYNKFRQKKFTKALSLLYVSPTLKEQDLAVIEIDSQADAEWDDLETSSVFKLSRWEIDKPAETSNEVTVWAFDPIIPGSPNSQTYPFGVNFNPRNCLAASRPDLTEFEELRATGTREKNNIPVSPVYITNHMRLDGCTSTTTGGNSGSLVTLKSDTSQIVGLMEAYRIYYHPTKLESFWYRSPIKPVGLIEIDNGAQENKYDFSYGNDIRTHSLGTVLGALPPLK